jgi:hypothetical protein
MLILNEDQIKQIAGELDAGFRCFIHKENLEIISLPDETSHAEMELDAWEQDMEKVDNNLNQYIRIDTLDSSDSFKIMEDFSNQVDDEKLKSRLISALNHRNPFRYFKTEIDNSGKYRQEWFDYKNSRLQQWVREQIEIKL